MAPREIVAREFVARRLVAHDLGPRGWSIVLAAVLVCARVEASPSAERDAYVEQIPRSARETPATHSARDTEGGLAHGERAASDRMDAPEGSIPGVDQLTPAQLATWAARTGLSPDEIARLIAIGRFDLLEVQEVARQTQDAQTATPRREPALPDTPRALSSPAPKANRR